MGLGFAYIDAKQAGYIDVSLGGASLEPRGGTTVRAVTLASGAIRYEHAIGPPWLRLYGRASYAGTTCSRDCGPMGSDRGVRVESAGIGVDFATAEDGSRRRITGKMVGVSVGLVYHHVSDELLGSGSFIGMEMSFMMGGDVLTGLVDEASVKY